MRSIRTPETEERYRKEKAERPADYGCPLCKSETVKDFTLWRVVKNDYPYDLIAAHHEMLLPKRHVLEEELTDEEKEEYMHIKRTWVQEQDYNYIAEATYGTKSIPEHHHHHLLTLRDDIWDRISS